MKNKKIFKLLTLTLASVMLASSLTACGISDITGNSDKTKQEEEKDSKKDKKDKKKDIKDKDKKEDDSTDKEPDEIIDEELDPDDDSIDFPKEKAFSPRSKELLNGYAGMLTTISMLGRLPENKNNYSSDYDFDYYYHIFSEYESYNYDTGEVTTCNHYMISDVDCDGTEELLIIVDSDNTCVADNCVIIYQYDVDTKDFTIEGYTYLNPEFYDNGYMLDYSSHNQTNGDLWPYTVNKYNTSTDSFDYMAYVTSWNKEYCEEDYSGNPFPDDLDADGDGIIYIVLDVDDKEQYMDNDEFSRWESQFTEGKLITDEVYPLLYSEYSSYTTDYIDLCLSDGLDSQSADVEFDLGRLFVNADNYSDYYEYYDYDDDSLFYLNVDAALTDKLSSFYIDKALPENDDFDEYIYYIDRKGDNVVQYSQMDAGSVSLVKKVDGLYLFGIQPGMSLDEASEILDTYHAYEYGEAYYNSYDNLTYSYYMIGSDANYISISLGLNSKNNVKTVGVYQGCSFAG